MSTERAAAIARLRSNWESFDFFPVATWKEGAYQIVRPSSPEGARRLASEKTALALGYDPGIHEEVLLELADSGLIFVLSIGSSFPLFAITIPSERGIHVSRIQYAQDMVDRCILMSAWRLLGLPEDHDESPFWEGEEARNQKHLDFAGDPEESEFAEIYRLLGEQPPWLLPSEEFQAWLEQVQGGGS